MHLLYGVLLKQQPHKCTQSQFSVFNCSQTHTEECGKEEGIVAQIGRRHTQVTSPSLSGRVCTCH